MDKQITAYIKAAKSMKKPVLYINPNYILGTDIEYKTISMITNYNCDVNIELATYAKDIYDEKSIQKVMASTPPVVFQNTISQVVDGLWYYNWESDKIKYKLSELANRVFMIISTRKPDIHLSTEEVLDCGINCKMKVDEGLQWVVIKDYLMCNFSQIHPLNASDSMMIDIYDDRADSYLVDFIINKKKYEIHEYIRFRKL